MRRTGRHAAPSQAHKVARAAGKAAPAVAVLGALAAVPQIHDLASAGHSGTAEHLTSAPLAGLAVAGNQPADMPATFRTAKYRPWPAATATPGGSSRTGREAAAHRPAAAAHPAAAHPAAAQPAASPSASATASGSSGAAGSSGSGAVPHCTGTQGMLPENYAAIVDFLTGHGYTGLAAAGIAGNIYQESKGNPESVGDGGGGLIGWTPLPSGFVTGNVAADLQTQLQALLTYNQGWAQFIPALNAATSATEAADIYMNDFERPGLPDAANREAAAQAVAAACGL